MATGAPKPGGFTREPSARHTGRSWHCGILQAPEFSIEPYPANQFQDHITQGIEGFPPFLPLECRTVVHVEIFHTVPIVTEFMPKNRVPEERRAFGVIVIQPNPPLYVVTGAGVFTTAIAHTEPVGDRQFDVTFKGACSRRFAGWDELLNPGVYHFLFNFHMIHATYATD